MDMGTEDIGLDMVMQGPITTLSLTARSAIIIIVITTTNTIIQLMIMDQVTYDVVTEEQCATHSVPECATVVRQVPEQVVHHYHHYHNCHHQHHQVPEQVIIVIILIVIITIFLRTPFCPLAIPNYDPNPNSP